MRQYTVVLADTTKPYTISAKGLSADEHWVRFLGGSPGASSEVVALFPTARVLYVGEVEADG